MEGLSPEQTEQLRRTCETVARNSLESVPIYQLRGRNVKESATALVLRKVTVKGGVLLAELGLPAHE